MAGSAWGASIQARATRVSGLGLAVLFGVVGLQRRDGEAIAFALVTLGATAGTVIGRGLPGRIALGLVALDTIVWLAPAALVNAKSGEDILDVVAPALLCVLATVLSLLVVGGRPRTVLVSGALLLAGFLGMSLAASREGNPPTADASVATKNMAFSPGKLTVRSGALLGAHNSDLFWHSFTISELGIDTRVPTGATRLVRVEAPSGSYRFVCAIPGHEAAGMHGILLVR